MPSIVFDPPRTSRFSSTDPAERLFEIRGFYESIIIDSGLLNRPVCVPWWNGATLRMVA
jgi:hypothetical protein